MASFRSLARPAVLLSLLSSLSLVSCLPSAPPTAHIINRAVVQSTNYDYVIVGGGLTGLVVANRLTEDPTKNVLVVEYGYLDNTSPPLIPGYANGLNYGDMYDITSAPIPFLNNATFPVWIGKVVGGGSWVNGMEFDRGTQADYNAWEALGNPGWGWDGMFPYFKKASHFTPPSAELQKEFNVTYDLAAYGNGPVQASIAPFIYPELPTFWETWREIGVPTPQEGAFGLVGAIWTPTSTDPKDETRSSARTAYYNPVASRKNLHLLTGHQVTEINFEDDLTACGVVIKSRADGTSISVAARKELILAAGAVHTPQLLQLSGIGPKAVLEAAGIPVKMDNPSVGANFQDHPVAYLDFNLTKDNYFPNAMTLSTNATYNATTFQQYLKTRTGPWTIAHGNSGAFLPLSLITSAYKTIANALGAQNATEYLPEIYSQVPALLAGFKAQRAILKQQFLGKTAAVHEFPFNGGGSVPAAFQKPLSRGSIALNLTSPTSEPIVTYNTLQNPTDVSIMLAMVRYTRKFFASPSMASLGPVEVLPGAAATTDDEILAVLKGGLLQPSFAHPSCSCAMMPEKLGGCVSSELLVYGTKKLSIIDASIMPVIVGAHLQETMYAIAEKAADIIKSRA